MGFHWLGMLDIIELFIEQYTHICHTCHWQKEQYFYTVYM